jgi:hypothetical protein
MEIEALIAIFICFSFGAFTAYKDIESFFIERKIGVSRIYRQSAALAFIVGNGLIGVGILIWALSDSTAAINTLLVDSVVGKGIIIGVSVPLIIRSKWYSMKQDGSSPAGLEMIYLKIREDVLWQVNKNSVAEKERIAEKFASLLEGNETVPEKVLQHVISIREPFVSKDQLHEIRAEFDAMIPSKANEVASKKHLTELILWAMNNCGIEDSEKYLKSINSGV